MQTTLIITGIIVVAFLIFRYLMVSKIKNTPLVADHQKVLTLTDKNFMQLTRNKVILIDFWAAWCAPCRMMAPVLNEVAAELPDNALVGKVDIEKYQVIAQKFKIRNIPTMVLLKNGIEVKRFVGMKSKDFLIQQVLKA